MQTPIFVPHHELGQMYSHQEIAALMFNRLLGLGKSDELNLACQNKDEGMQETHHVSYCALPPGP